MYTAVEGDFVGRQEHQRCATVTSMPVSLCLDLPALAVDNASLYSVERPATPSAREALAAHPVSSALSSATEPTSTRFESKRPASYLSLGSSMGSDIEAKAEAAAPIEWKPTKKELLVMISLSFISLMVALDATILVTVLPVGILAAAECLLLTMSRRSHTLSMDPQPKLSGQVLHSRHSVAC